MLHCTLDSTMASFAEFDASGTVSEFALSVADAGTSNHEIFRGLSEVPCSFSNATFCNRYFHVIVCHRLQHSGRPREATSPPLFFDQTKARGAKKKCFWRLSPPHLSQGLDDLPPPPYLKAWIHHCNIYTYMSLWLYVVIEKATTTTTTTKKEAK